MITRGDLAIFAAIVLIAVIVLIALIEPIAAIALTALLAALAATLLGIRTGPRYLRRALERRQRRRWMSNQLLFAAQPPSRRALLGVAAVQVLLLGICASVDLRFTLWPVVTLAAGVLLILSVLVTHGLPQHNRTAKYILLWIGIYLFLIHSVMSTGTDGVCWPLVYIPATFLVAAALCGIVRDSVVLRRGPWLQAFSMHRLSMMLAPSLSVGGVVALYPPDRDHLT